MLFVSLWNNTCCDKGLLVLSRMENSNICDWSSKGFDTSTILGSSDKIKKYWYWPVEGARNLCSEYCLCSFVKTTLASLSNFIYVIHNLQEQQLRAHCLQTQSTTPSRSRSLPTWRHSLICTHWAANQFNLEIYHSKFEICAGFEDIEQAMLWNTNPFGFRFVSWI